jgi:hypothetical protein
MIQALDILDEALETVSRAEGKGLGLRLLGGLAIRAACPSARDGALARVCGDMDFASLGPSRELEAFFLGSGWAPHTEFNLYNGSRRLIFTSPRGHKADVFVGAFCMCHPIPFKGRLGLDPLRLPLAELLLTKLQVVEANAKDLSDGAAILLDHELGSGDGELINAGRLAEVLADDWGFWRTCMGSLGKIADWAPGSGLEPEAKGTLGRRLEEARSLLESCPKGPRWKIRSLLGERLRWYEEPEEAEA